MERKVPSNRRKESTCHLPRSDKAPFVWFRSPNLMDLMDLMGWLVSSKINEPNQYMMVDSAVSKLRLNFFSASARCTPCFWCNMISRCGPCLWMRHPHAGIRWEGTRVQGLFCAWHPSKALVLQSDVIVQKWQWNEDFLIVIGRVL